MNNVLQFKQKSLNIKQSQYMITEEFSPQVVAQLDAASEYLKNGDTTKPRPKIILNMHMPTVLKSMVRMMRSPCSSKNS